MLDRYRIHVAERAALGLPPQPLTRDQTAAVIARLTGGASGAEAAELAALLAERVPPGVDPAAKPKAELLADVARGRLACAAIDRRRAVAMLGAMLGGYNVAPLIELLADDEVGDAAAAALAGTVLVFDAFHDVAAVAAAGNPRAAAVLASWAEATWLTDRPPVPDRIPARVLRIAGEVNTDDLSPAPHAWSRPDIPLHARSLLESGRHGVADPLAAIARLGAEGDVVAFVADVVGTGSSRKSAVNSLVWHLGDDIPGVPNKRRGGVVMAATLAPIFATTLRDAGALPIACDVGALAMGDAIELDLAGGRVADDRDRTLARFELADTLLDEVRAGGRLRWILGRTLTERAREHLGLGPSPVARRPRAAAVRRGGFTRAQKLVGRACGAAGVRPGDYCEPRMSTVGSQDTTGPMTRDELTELACLGFSADLVLQTFCHTAAYPRRLDVDNQRSLAPFFASRGGVVLRPGDGVIHSWMNRLLVPDRVGTGGDSHTRFPLGISFPAGSGLVAFAAALGVMPLTMPASVRVRFVGERQPGITTRDLVHAIPWAARRQGLLTVGGADKRNPFAGRILEIDGLAELSVEQAFELTDATAERSAAGCTIELSESSVVRHVRSSLALIASMREQGYGDARALERRAGELEAWLADPRLVRADADADYLATVEVDMSEITEPLLCCPNDPDDVRPLGEVAGAAVDEVFLGSCMTHIDHFRAAARVLDDAPPALATRLWVAPPTRMDEAVLRAEGVYASFARVGARTEVPGCSLCMGNQARVAANATVVSTSTRNFPNRLGTGANVYLASAELSAVAAALGRLPTVAEYRAASAP